MASLHSLHPGTHHVGIINLPASPIRRIPRETVCNILSFLPEENDLKSAVLSNKIFSKGFSCMKQRIFAQVRLNSMDETVLRLAYTAAKAQGIDHRQKKEIEVFFKQEIGKYLPETFTRQEMLDISVLHGYIEPLSARIAPWLIELAPGYPSEATGPPSNSELFRIQRALLFFHIITTLYPVSSMSNGVYLLEKNNNWFYDLLTDQLTPKLADWEFRQVATISDFFVESCSEEYYDFFPCTPYHSWCCDGMACSNLYRWYIMTAGIPKLSQLLNGRVSLESLHRDLKDLSTHVGNSTTRDMWFILYPPDINHETPFTPEDTDVGPALMWNWGIRTYEEGELYPENPNYDYKSNIGKWEFSYSMFWDLDRMEVMTEGRCSCVRWDRDEDGPAWPEWNGFDD